MSDDFKYTEEDLADPSFIAIVCGVCDIEIGYEPCSNGCDPLTKYLGETHTKNVSQEDWDSLSSISLNEAIELVKKWLEKKDSDE
jgi:hypothetical protein